MPLAMITSRRPCHSTSFTAAWASRHNIRHTWRWGWGSAATLALLTQRGSFWERAAVIVAPTPVRERAGGDSRGQSDADVIVGPLRLRRLLISSTLLPLAVGMGAGAEEEPSEEDVRILQNAYAGVRKIGDFPSKAALADADAQLTECYRRWSARGTAAAPAEVSAILRFRGNVRRRAGSINEALADLESALKVLGGPASSDTEELPRVLAARAEVFATVDRWQEALVDYDHAAELMGDPLEVPSFLSARAWAKQRLKMHALAAEDFHASALQYRRIGHRIEAEIELERSGLALLGAGEASFGNADKALCGVILRSIGLMSEDVALLQRVVIADIDARVAMAALSWHRCLPEIAETYWRDACARLDTLSDAAEGKQLAIGFTNGETYRCKRYVSDAKWLREKQGWPEAAIGWLSEFWRDRPGTLPRDAYLSDLAVGKCPGVGSTFIDLVRARALPAS